MVEFNVVKYCRSCKQRFVVARENSKKNYCDKCQASYEKRMKEENKR